MDTFFSDYIGPFILAILQGITEFLPISSSGHLVLLDILLPIESGLFFDLVLHLATLISVVAFYRKDIASIFMGCIREFKPQTEKTNLKFVGYLLVATAITAVMGLLLEDWVELKLRKLVYVGILLMCNAGVLWFSKEKGLLKLTSGELNLKTAALIGLAQGIAVLPGISRSGSTITTALILGVAPKDCAKISFLLSIPVICGAVILKLPKMLSMSIDNAGVIIAAAVVASIVGYISLVVLDKLLKKANFHYFAPYCLVVGLIAVVLGALGIHA